MTHDPEVWAVLGRALRSDRERQGLTREQLAERVRMRGGQISARSIGSLEAGVVPKRGSKPPSLEPAAAALGWSAGWTDRILAGEDPSAVLEGETPVMSRADMTPHQLMLELVPDVYEFGRLAVQAGAPAEARDYFEAAVQRLLAAVPSGRSGRAGLALAAYRPHAVGEGVPDDDAARIRDALNRDS
ncbi:hypothetical protein ABTX34_11080 [Streptomyces sp. NPDC096538]|uniref:hypothetical protein n=1 Tax=Streptomyces sp. NPDC096538 TaxID=3155427 RepID=UPI00331BC3A1